MNELAFFAGAGGGLLGSHIADIHTVCAVERDAYAASVLAQRQTDRILPLFPIWSDAASFDGRPWRGIARLVSGGFPCQDISPAGGGGQESMVKSPARGTSCGTVFALLDPSGSGWKIPQYSLLEDLTSFSETWPRSGMMRSGMCSERITSAPRTNGIESGYWPTPTTSESCESRESIQARVQRGKARGLSYGPNSGIKLGTAVMYPTPCSTDHKGAGKTGELRDRLDYAVERGATKNKVYSTTEGGGKLNPNWVEWLMGWPIGWTELKPLEMDKYLQWQHSHIEPSKHDFNK